MVCAPGDRVLTEIDAVPALRVPLLLSLRALVPRSLPPLVGLPSQNCTLPDGDWGFTLLAATTDVKVSESPKADGLAPDVKETVVLVEAWLTVWVMSPTSIEIRISGVDREDIVRPTRKRRRRIGCVCVAI